jgi:hypothetical protein
MTVSYPSNISKPIKATKTRTQGAVFRVSDPRLGYAYAQVAGMDVPVAWDVSWVFTASEALAFMTWFNDDLQRGLLEFSLPLRTEFGDVEHICRLSPDSLLPASQDGQAWTYSARIMARKLLRPAVYDDAADLIIGLPDWPNWSGKLDQAITQEMPQA